jgi:hypothetical protein
MNMLRRGSRLRKAFIWREIGDHASLAQSLNNLGDVLSGNEKFFRSSEGVLSKLCQLRRRRVLFPLCWIPFLVKRFEADAG